MPPYHWAAWRYMSIPRPGRSKSASTVDPEAVNPEVDSKRLSTIWAASPAPPAAKVPAARKGRAPTRVVAAQVQPTAENTSRLRTAPGAVKYHAPIPAAATAAPETASAAVSRLVVSNSSSAQASIPAETKLRAMPQTWKVVLW